MTHPYYLKTVENGYTPEGAASYKLIADQQSSAAPEMLEALEFIRKELSQHVDRYAGNNPVMYSYRRADEAIAKARGE